MFLDNLGHGFKDAVIFFLIIFSTILSINVLTMNDSLNWWKDEVIVSNLKGADDHGPDDFAGTLAIINLIVIGLVICYFFYYLIVKNKIVGIKN